MPKGINSRDVQVALAQDADKVHPWPKQIAIGPDVAAYAVYEQAQLQRPHGSWSPLDLMELARTAKMIAFVDVEWEKFEREGALILGGRRGDTLIENPRGRTIGTLNATISASLRRLGLGPSVLSQSERKGEQAKASMQREIRATHAGNDKDDISLI